MTVPYIFTVKATKKKFMSEQTPLVQSMLFKGQLYLQRLILWFSKLRCQRSVIERRIKLGPKLLDAHFYQFNRRLPIDFISSQVHELERDGLAVCLNHFEISRDWLKHKSTPWLLPSSMEAAVFLTLLSCNLQPKP